MIKNNITPFIILWISICSKKRTKLKLFFSHFCLIFTAINVDCDTTCGTIGRRMGQIDKLIKKAKTSPTNLTFEELCHLAELAGFILRKGKGTSHRVYKHPVHKNEMMNFQKGPSGKAKDYQVRQLVDCIDKYNLL